MTILTAADVMQNHVLTVNSHVSIADAARIMLRNRVSGLPVIDWEGRLVGIVTEGDLLRRSEIGTGRRRSRWLELLLGPGYAAAEYTAEHGRKVSEVMSDHVVAVVPRTPLAEIVALMEQHHIKRVPVLSGQKLIGILSRADLLRALVEAAVEFQVTVADDLQIREQVQHAVDQERWSPRATIKIDVQNGIVKLSGCITDDRERTALTVLAENVPGVKKVIDELVWVEPLSGMVLEPSERESADNPDRTTR
jgi:CBS domain-containing protein